MLAAIENIESFSGDSSLSSWLTGILKHKIVDCVRRSTRDQWQQLDNDGVPLNDDDRVQSGSASESVGPEQSLARRQLWKALLICMQDLPERTADTYVLREFVGMNTAEACRTLAISESNCAVMLFRARARIRQNLDPDWKIP